jgi:hypothetical protein
MLLSALGKSLLSGRKKKKSKSGKEMSQQVLNRSSKEDEKLVIKPQNSLVPLSIKTTTIPTANLITTKEDSIKDKLVMIKDLLGLQLKFRLSSWSEKIKNMREERRKKREKELEENKQKKKKSSFLNLLPKTGILDSLKNFLAFLAGGFLLNLLFKYLPELEKIGKMLAPIIKGIMQFGKFMWEGVIGFITKAYAGYDALRESIRDIGGDDAVEKFDKVAELLKKVINGALIAAAIALVARPFMRKGKGGKGGDGYCPPCKPCVCRVPDPQRVPALATQLSAVTQLQPDAVMDPVRSPGFNWGRIFDPIRDILGALQKKRKTNEEASGTAVQDQPAYATESLTSAVTTVTKLIEDIDEQKVEEVIPLTTQKTAEPEVFYTPEQFDDAPVPEVSPLAPVGTILNVTGKILQIVPALFGIDFGLKQAGAMGEGGTVPPISPMDKSYDDLATNTSYSIGSYGMITNTTTIIQPVVQEV